MDSLQRGPQFMVNMADELIFCLVEVRQVFIGLFQLPVAQGSVPGWLP